MDLLKQAIETAAVVSQPTDGLVTRRALLRASVSRALVQRMVAIRHLRRVLHGIYLVGAARLTQRQLYRVALMRAGVGGCLTARSGLETRRVLSVRRGVATGLTTRSRAAGFHRTLVPMESGGDGLIRLRRIDAPTEAEPVDGLPVARVGRALSDPVAFGDGALLTQAWGDAEFRGLLDADVLRADVGTGRRRGAADLAALLATREILTDPDSDLRGKTELPWLHEMVAAGIPMPAVNAPVHAAGQRYFADFLFVDYDLALELDSPDHLTPVVAAGDRVRDDDFDSIGISTLRFIDTLALADPVPHLERLKAALRRRGWDGSAA